MLLSVQLYTVRDCMNADVAGTLARLREMGLERVELAGTYGLPADEFRSLLDTTGLEVSGSHLGLDTLEADIGAVIVDHQTLRCRRVILPWISKEVYADGWAAFGRRLEPIADQLADSGIEFAYHNHAFEFESGSFGELFETTSVRVKAQLDLGWVHHAGQSPADWVRRLGDKVTTVHLKDMTSNPESLDCIAGTGTVDWDSALAACREVGVQVGVIEMDVPPGDPLESVEKCLRFFESRA